MGIFRKNDSEYEDDSDYDFLDPDDPSVELFALALELPSRANEKFRGNGILLALKDGGLHFNSIYKAKCTPVDSTWVRWSVSDESIWIVTRGQVNPFVLKDANTSKWKAWLRNHHKTGDLKW